VLTTRREALLSALGLAAATPRIVRANPQFPAAVLEPPQAGAAGEHPVSRIVSLADFEAAARGRMSHMAYEYVAGGAADEITLEENRLAYDRIQLRPRVLVDVTLLGETLPFPILLAPTAYHRLVHPEGELATVRGAAAAGATTVVSSFATTSVEEIARAARAPLWFQLYVQPDRGLTRELVQRAEASGCRAICVTVDSPVVGPRNREARAGFALPAGLERSNLRRLGAAVAGAAHRPSEGDIYSAVHDPTLSWKDIEWLRSVARVPVLLKGIMAADDARIAAENGVAGLMVSNHGARNLDTLPATLDALPGVVDAVAGRVPVLVDGGIRRGTDVLKALARGAAAVLIGRPYLYGLAVEGDRGVARVINILHGELRAAMAFTGRASIAAVDRTVLWPAKCL
jgi:4-hydroxymandelate oxidase